MADIDLVIEKYVQTRDKKAEIVKGHKEQLAPYNNAMEKMENLLLKELNSMNAESFKTANGTAYTAKRSSVKILDWDTTLEFLIENDMTHMLTRSLAKASVAEFVEANQANVPGTDIVNETVVQVRRK